MGLRARRACGFGSILVLVAAASAGLRPSEAQTGGEAPRSALDSAEAGFESLGRNLRVNLPNVAYIVDYGEFYDIYFSCSSSRGTDPLRIRDARDRDTVKTYFDDEKRYGKHFVKAGRYRINPRNIAFIEAGEGLATINFNARVLDSFAQLKLTGADAEIFTKQR